MKITKKQLEQLIEASIEKKLLTLNESSDYPRRADDLLYKNTSMHLDQLMHEFETHLNASYNKDGLSRTLVAMKGNELDRVLTKLNQANEMKEKFKLLLKQAENIILYRLMDLISKEKIGMPPKE